MKIERCPYCGKRLSYFEAFSYRRSGEYFCNKCGKESNVYFKRTLLIPYVIALIIGILVALFFILTKEKTVLLFMFLALIPFIVFYILCPYFLKLRPMKKYMDSLYNTNYELQLNQKREEEQIFNPEASEDDEPIINTDVFDAIKNERGAVVDSTQEKTKSFSRYEDISSSSADKDLDKTKRIR